MVRKPVGGELELCPSQQEALEERGALLASCLCSQFFLLSWQKHREGGSRQFELWPQIGSIELGSEAGAVAIGESDGGDCF